MKQFIVFIHKEFLHIFRDRRTTLVLLVMPVVLITLFGYALSNETKHTRIALVDESHSYLVQRLRQRIDQNPYFEVVADVHTSADAMTLFEKSEIDLAMVVPDGFPNEAIHSGELDLQVLVDGSEPNQATVRSNYIQQILMDILIEDFAVEPQVVIDTHMLYNPQARSEYNFVPGIIGVILMLICAMMTSISIVREKELGTIEVLLASPLHPLVILIAKLIPYFVVSSVNVSTILLLSKFVLDVPIAGNLMLFSAITLIYIIAALSLGILISIAVNTQLAAMLISLLLFIPAVYLSGLVFPIESMPFPISKVATVLPTTLYIDAARKIMIQGVEVQFVARNIILLLMQCTLLLTISLKLFKTRLE